jgi:uncharacterized protein (DUF362 family)
MLEPLDRRGFLRTLAGGALALPLAEGALIRIAWSEDASHPAPSDVTVVGLRSEPDDAEIKERMRQAVMTASNGLSWLAPNQTVVIKVASNSGKGYPFTTSPAALRALIEILKEKEPTTRVIVADQPGVEWLPPSFGSDAVGKVVRSIWGKVYSGAASGHDVLRMNGLLEAAQSAGAEVETFDKESDWVRVAPTEHWPKGLRIPKLYGEADHVINLVRPSGHEVAGHTATLKSWYGWLHPDDRLRSHTIDPLHPSHGFWNLNASIAEVANTFKEKTRLNVVAAIGSYADVGPDWGKQPLEQSMIIASTDMVAADAVTAALVAREKHRVPFSERALNWMDDPHPWRNRHSPQDTAFWAGIQGSPLGAFEGLFMGLAQRPIHRLSGTDGGFGLALGGFDGLVRRQGPGEVYDLPQIARARAIGLGAEGGVKITVATDAPIAAPVASDLQKLTAAPSTGLIRSLPDEKKR